MERESDCSVSRPGCKKEAITRDVRKGKIRTFKSWAKLAALPIFNKKARRGNFHAACRVISICIPDRYIESADILADLPTNRHQGNIRHNLEVFRPEYNTDN